MQSYIIFYIPKKHEKKKYNNTTLISKNKTANYKYSIYEQFEAGLVLYGWEVKGLRNEKCNIQNNHIVINYNEAYLLGVLINNKTLSQDIKSQTRIRKLLLKRQEINFIYGKIHNNIYTAIALALYWKNNLCKVKIAIAKGKKQYDKRNAIKKREWLLHKNRINKHKI